MTAENTPVVFVHGLWLHATSWRPWVDLFRDRGYDAQAPDWPGESATVEATRKSPEAVAGNGIDAVVEHYARAIDALPARPIVIGHSFGGLIVQRLLAQGSASAGVAIDAAPVKGVIYLPPSALRVASVALRNPANRKRAVSLTRKQFRYGFGNALSEHESDELFEQWTIPSAGRPLFEAAMANLSRKSPAKVDTSRGDRGPLLLIAGGRDRTVPASVTRSTLKLYRKSSAVTDYKEFDDRGHTLALDSEWQEIADYALGWLKTQGL